MSNILNVEQSYIVQMWNWLVSEAPGLVFLSHTVMRPRDSVFVSVFSVFSAFRGSSAVTTECTEHTENTETTDVHGIGKPLDALPMKRTKLFRLVPNAE